MHVNCLFFHFTIVSLPAQVILPQAQSLHNFVIAVIAVIAVISVLLFKGSQKRGYLRTMERERIKHRVSRGCPGAASCLFSFAAEIFYRTPVL